MTPFQLTNKAKADLRDIALFTERRWGRKQRNVYIRQLDATFGRLAENPELGKTCDEIRPGYRKFPQASHVIFYQKTNNQPNLIIRILHKSMDVNSTFSSRD
ncbi:type II toxin-antitoxin system RelE/ParE family toxin [Vibrio splendidus]|uniref:type II toxin-antitoxin system RelE/ParE family toxin n=1 Tax=Vibrio splendidus TaxID=29497 RepID=UPI000C864F5B|nr:type II toxin-antitoxin system RelE/ParE family toxin [Vibrio splendidus]PMN36967.1 plasmid stabilization protein ParE [Vibrio splendidus]